MYNISIIIIHRRGSPDAKISCVVSVGCGVYPPEPLGNTDIADALKMKNLHKLPSRLKELLNLLTTAVSPRSTRGIIFICTCFWRGEGGKGGGRKNFPSILH